MVGAGAEQGVARAPPPVSEGLAVGAGGLVLPAPAHLQPGLGVAVPADGEAGARVAVVGGEIPVLEETSGENLH